ncbi:MAG: hypothetical protein Kow00108_06880 [Calditrichia bacterium]
MQFLPDWAPNWHPLIIHFPIVLIIFGVLADFARGIFKKATWLNKTALFLYGGGTIFAIIAYFTGKAAADSVFFPPEGYPVVSTHADYALYTVIFLGIFFLIRAFFAYKKWDKINSWSGVLVLAGLVGVLLIQKTAEYGGMLVYKYAVGTSLQKEPSEIKPEKTTSKIPASTINVSEDGSWLWMAQKHPLELFHWIGLKTPKYQYADKDSQFVKLNINTNTKVLAVLGPDLSDVQVNTEVDLTSFNGSFYLIHHFLDSSTYDFFSVGKEKIVLGRLNKGKIEMMDTKKFNQQRRLIVKVVGTKGHFRGYVNNKLLLHGHAGDLPAGSAGFGFEGKGFIKLKYINVVSLKTKEEHGGEHAH